MEDTRSEVDEIWDHGEAVTLEEFLTLASFAFHRQPSAQMRSTAVTRLLEIAYNPRPTMH